jgi:hypothetical protein
MRTLLRFAILLLALGVIGISFATYRPHAQEIGEEEVPAVSENDLQMYIAVYKAMQSDHDLTIENAIQSHGVTLDDFRQIERRIQTQTRLVDRVREALLEYAKSHSAFAQAPPTPTAIPEPKAVKRKKK